MPGAVLMWLEYMFPVRGQVLASGRRHGNRIVQVIYTVGLYGAAGLLLYLYLRRH